MKLFSKFQFFIVFLTLFPSACLAIDEAQLLSQYDSLIKPYIGNNFIKKSFDGKNGITIQCAYKLVENEKAALVIIGGRTESYLKYQELFYDLNHKDYSIYSYDQRGQGLSDRLLEDSNKGHVVDYNNYVEDLKTFIETIVQPKTHNNIIVIGHSMGGLTAVLYCLQNPGVVDGLIAVSPMFAINTKPYPQILAEWISKTAVSMGFNNSYIIGGKPYDENISFSDNNVTSSQSRFEFSRNIFRDYPVLKIGSPTFKWLSQSFIAMQRSIQMSKYLKTQMLLLQGQDDTVVDLNSQDVFCKQAHDCTMIKIPKAKHEILMEKDQVRNRALEEIQVFINTFSQKL